MYFINNRDQMCEHLYRIIYAFRRILSWTVWQSMQKKVWMLWSEYIITLHRTLGSINGFSYALIPTILKINRPSMQRHLSRSISREIWVDKCTKLCQVKWVFWGGCSQIDMVYVYVLAFWGAFFCEIWYSNWWVFIREDSRRSPNLKNGCILSKLL